MTANNWDPQDRRASDFCRKTPNIEYLKPNVEITVAQASCLWGQWPSCPMILITGTVV
jgi:hypothetical protein